MSRLIYSGPSRSGTTVGARFLNMHPDVCMTNEVGIYRLARADGYVKRIYDRINKNDNFSFNIDKGFDISGLLSIETIDKKQAVLEVESVLFGNKYKFFGDKGIFSSEADFIRDLGLDFDLIVIHRDPRDVVSSVIRHRGSTYGYDSGDDPAIILKNWKDNMEDMLLSARMIAKRSLVIKFEDFIEHPGMNSKKIEEFLGLTGFESLEKEAFLKESSNMGYYNSLFPNWRDYLTEDLIEFADVLGYEF